MPALRDPLLPLPREAPALKRSKGEPAAMFHAREVEHFRANLFASAVAGAIWSARYWARRLTAEQREYVARVFAQALGLRIASAQTGEPDQRLLRALDGKTKDRGYEDPTVHGVAIDQQGR